MMMKVDFTSSRNVGRRPRGLLVTLFVHWVVKPFSMALIGWLFFRILFSAWISPAEADQYIAGVIILAAAPCTAMVFVWSYLTDGDTAYTLVQVSVNDLIMLVLFAPIVRFLVSGASSLSVPFLVCPGQYDRWLLKAAARSEKAMRGCGRRRAYYVIEQ
jgi:arsenite transporter